MAACLATMPALDDNPGPTRKFSAEKDHASQLTFTAFLCVLSVTLTPIAVKKFFLRTLCACSLRSLRLKVFAALTLFSPSQPLRRLHSLTMLIRNLASPQFTVSVKFTDAFWWAASSTWKVSGKLPVWVGVPHSHPAQPVGPVFE